MDRAATRQQSQSPLAVFRTVDAPRPRSLGGVDWHGDPRIIRELYELGFAATCDEEAAGGIATDGEIRDCVTTIKSGPHRSVFRIALPSGVVFLKHFKTSNVWDALRNTLRGTQAQREAHAAARVLAAGIDSIECAATGVQVRGPLAADSFLISREIAEAVPLDRLVRDPAHVDLRTPKFRRQLSRALGHLCGQLHRAGLVHRDLHPANLLAQVSEGPEGNAKAASEIRLTLIDLQGVRPRRARGLAFRHGARARWDLFGLFNFFHTTAGRADRCRFLHAYLDKGKTSRDLPAGLSDQMAPARLDHRKLGQLARKIEAFCWRSLRREQIRYDKKWQRSNRRLVVADAGRTCCRGLSSLGTDQVLELRANPESLFRPDRLRFWLRRTPTDRAAVVDLWATGEAICCEARETSRPSGWHDLLPRFRWSNTRRAWEMGHALRRRGLPTQRTLFYLETRSVSQVCEILVKERLSRSVPLNIFLAHQFPTLTNRQQEAWIKDNCRKLASALARMREFSLIHRSLTASDLLVSTDANKCCVQVGGTDRIVKKSRLSRRSRVASLGQLYASVAPIVDLRPTQLLRFLKKYFGDCFAAEWKSTWRAIAHAQPQAKPAFGRLTKTSPALLRTARAAGLLLAAGLVLSGCQAIDRPITLPVKHQVKCEQLLVLSDFKLQKDHELIRELSTLREQEARLLELPLQRDPVVVYLFNNETEYRKYMAATYPKLPPRSAYFVGSATELAVYTHWGQTVREDLRHEYTHGLLHSAMKRVPLWLDEGLAEYFEVSGPQPGTINREYATKLSTLLAQGWRPDLKRLEALGDDAQMRRADYQEAWAWVHFMLHGSPEAKRVLLSYLKDLRTVPDPKSISRRLATECPDFQERSMSYMAKLSPERQVVEALSTLAVVLDAKGPAITTPGRQPVS